MADHELQAGVCAENWWTTMNLSSGNSFGSSSTFSPLSNMENFSWPSDFDMKTRASDESGSEGSTVDIQKPINQESVGLSSSTLTTDCNYQTLLHDSNRSANNCDSLISNYQRDDNITVDYSRVKQDWSLENFSAIDHDSSIDASRGPIIDQGFPMSSSLFGYPYNSVIQTLFDTDTDSDQESLQFANGTMDYPAIANTISRERLNEISSSFLKPNSLVLPPKQQPLISHSYLPNNFTWNTSSDGLSTPVQSQILSPRYGDKLINCPDPSIKSNKERIREMMMSTVRNNISEQEFKRARIETPSPLPTFKVRKEKLGDRVTALQQLVSPFGKTDTASVLHEAIEYIKLLHDQVTVLITPYIKRGSSFQHEKNLTDPKGADEGVVISQELRSRGLCLVPISSTFPVAAETTADLWTPTFGGSFR